MSVEDFIITDHGDNRVRKRLGIPRRAVERLVSTALEQGYQHRHYTGSFRKYLDRVYLKERKANNMRVHAGHLFLFHDNYLITCWSIPQEYRNARPRLDA